MTIPFLPLIGIDLGSSAVKVAEFSGGKGRRKLKALGLELLPEEAVVDGNIQDEEQVEDVLLSLLERMKINPVGRRAAIAVGAPHTEVKRVLVDIGRGDLEEQMNYEAEQHFQNDIGDLAVQYQQLSGWSEDPSRVPVLLVGAMRDVVEQHVGLLRSIGLRTGVIDCDTICLSNIFEYNYPVTNKLVALINIGSVVSTITLVCNGQYLYMKPLAFGGEEYTRQLISNLGVEYGNAEAMKLTVSRAVGSTAAPDEMQRVINDLNEALANEIQETLKLYFESSTPIPGITGLDQIFIAGGGARVLGLVDGLNAAFQVPVNVINPFGAVDINPKNFDVDYILGQGHIFAVAAGLALRSIGDDEGKNT